MPRRRVAASAACLLVLALAVAGCAALGAALGTSLALQNAGYQNVTVNVATGTGLPANGSVTVYYSSGPAGNDQRDAQRAEKVVWDNFPGRFGVLEIVKVSGGCAGPVCATKSDEVASALYAQLAVAFGPRPPGLDKASGGGVSGLSVLVIVFGVGSGVVAIAAAAIILTFLLMGKRSRPPSPPGPPPWQPWPPDGPPYPTSISNKGS